MYDIVIIGGGIAGLTASIYGARGGASVLVIDPNVGGQIINSNDVQNYPGFKSISGSALINNVREQAKNLGVTILEESVISAKDGIVHTKNKDIEYKTIIIASGVKNNKLGVPGEDELLGCGVSYCATCDGAFFKDRDVVVVGGGNTALEDAIYLSNIANTVYLVHRRNEFRADKISVDKVMNTPNIQVILNDEVSKINGNLSVQTVDLKSGKSLNVHGVFIAIGGKPVTEIFAELVDIDNNGFIISDDTTTKRDNVFVAGDVRVKSLRQLVTAASDGAIAATNALKYLGK